MNAYDQRPTHPAALFVMVKIWKYAKCLSIGKWTNSGRSMQWNTTRWQKTWATGTKSMAVSRSIYLCWEGTASQPKSTLSMTSFRWPSESPSFCAATGSRAVAAGAATGGQRGERRRIRRSWPCSLSWFADKVTDTHICQNVSYVLSSLFTNIYKLTCIKLFINNFIVFHCVNDYIVISSTTSQLKDTSLVCSASLS